MKVPCSSAQRRVYTRACGEKVALSEGLRTIGFPECPEAGLDQSVREKVTLIKSVCNFVILSRSVWENVMLRNEEGVLSQSV